MNLSDRMKELERVEAGRKADSNLPLMVRIDGRCFSKFTKNLIKPFDKDFLRLMDATTQYLMEETDAKMAYTQSDEITLSFYNDKENHSNSEYMFGGKYQKLTSVLASMATSYFTFHMRKFLQQTSDYPHFDCRVWNVPDVEHIALNYLWRYRDAIKNSVFMFARSYFSHKELQKKNTKEIISMLKDLPSQYCEDELLTSDWNKLFPRIKVGQMYRTQNKLVMLSDEELQKIPEKFREPLKFEPVIRNVIVPVPGEIESSVLDSELIFKTVKEIYGAKND